MLNHYTLFYKIRSFRDLKLFSFFLGIWAFIHGNFVPSNTGAIFRVTVSITVFLNYIPVAVDYIKILQTEHFLAETTSSHTHITLNIKSFQVHG